MAPKIQNAITLVSESEDSNKGDWQYYPPNAKPPVEATLEAMSKHWVWNAIATWAAKRFPGGLPERWNLVAIWEELARMKVEGSSHNHTLWQYYNPINKQVVKWAKDRTVWNENGGKVPGFGRPETFIAFCILEWMADQAGRKSKSTPKPTWIAPLKKALQLNYIVDENSDLIEDVPEFWKEANLFSDKWLQTRMEKPKGFS
jgi:hypothetical protein